MQNSKTKSLITATILATGIGAFSVSAHEGENHSMMSPEGMSGMQGMGDMGGMMTMMSDMAPEDRKAMTEACMKMMQSDGGKDKSGNAE